MNELVNAYALLIGTSYDDGLDTIGDATDIANILKDPNISTYPPENVILLTGDKADRKGILEALDWLIEKTDEKASVFLYYSGHGGAYDSEKETVFYFCAHGFPMLYQVSLEEAEELWVTAEELKARINALQTRRLIFFIDCCHSAGMAQGNFKMGNQGAEQERPGKFTRASGLAQKVDTERGISIVASCKEEQESYKFDDDKNSVFTKHLIAALNGHHQTEFADPYIRILEVAGYLLRVIPPIIEKAWAEADPPEDRKQEPYVNLELYDNFVLSYVPKEKRPALSTPAAPAADKPIPEDKGQKEVKTIFRESPGNNNLLLFVHGFSGEAGETFGRIPEMLMADSQMDGWDLKPFGYSRFIDPELGKDIWAGVQDISRIAEYLCTSIQYKFEKYDRIAIVAHSLGGLIAQRAILDFKPAYLSKLSHLLLLATPSMGIEQARLQKLWGDKYSEMSSEGSFISNLRREWAETFKSGHPFSLKTVASTEDEYISVTSCFSPFEEANRITVKGRHLNLVKPENEQDDCYQLILSTLTNSPFHNQYTNSEEINIALGHYDQVYNQLWDIRQDLDRNGLKRLVFALEGLEEHEKALELLESHPIAQEDTDLMGIIGGRYKREYLKKPTVQNGETAFVYYQLALEKATAKKNYDQIYYHAINLAFLSLILYDNRTDMQRYAEQSLHVAKNCADNLWKYATIAEAHMYLGQMDEARQFYKKASALAGIREKISMHTNAYAGYTTLTDTSNPEEPFIIFLKNHFLS